MESPSAVQSGGLDITATTGSSTIVIANAVVEAVDTAVLLRGKLTSTGSEIADITVVAQWSVLTAGLEITSPMLTLCATRSSSEPVKGAVRSIVRVDNRF